MQIKDQNLTKFISILSLLCLFMLFIAGGYVYAKDYYPKYDCIKSETRAIKINNYIQDVLICTKPDRYIIKLFDGKILYSNLSEEQKSLLTLY